MRPISTISNFAAMAALVVAAASSVAEAQSTQLVRIQDLQPRELRMEAFTLDRDATVRVEATGAESRNDSWSWGPVTVSNRRDDRPMPWQGNAWILNSRTRDVVWELSESRTEGNRRVERQFAGDVRLSAGTYEVYYASFPDGWRDDDQKDSRWFESRDRERILDLTRTFRVAVSGEGRHVTPQDVAQARAAFSKGTVLSLTNTRPSTPLRAGFSIDQPTDFDVYMIGEAGDEQAYDYGWIVNADTRTKVWEFKPWRADPAGGADKNRMARNTIRLEPGRYGVTWVSDDSHYPDHWNAPPPHDPSFYGMTLKVHNAADSARVKLFAYSPLPTTKPIVDLTRIGDRASPSAGFTLNKPMDVRIYALGEGAGDTMNDYGWIVDATTRRRVWSMDIDQTDHAGGAQKNRLVDQVLHLDRGSYIVYYVSDGSHSYDEWNASPPMDQKFWGISLYPANEADRSAVATYEEKKDASILAELIRQRDDSHERSRFKLDREESVRIYAIGEGQDGEMFDYGWIEDANTGGTAWRMRYDDTESAGGARKNRQVVAVIRLQAGEYIVHYRTDGSHSFGDWNADPPSDPLHWGITVYRATKQ